MFKSTKPRSHTKALCLTAGSIGIVAGLLAACTTTATVLGEVGRDLKGNDAVQNQNPEYVPGEVIVKFASVPDAAMLDRVSAELGFVISWRPLIHTSHYKGQPNRANPLAFYRVANVDKNADIPAMTGQFEAVNGIVVAEPNGYTQIALVPNDPRYNEQYGPEIMNTEPAWDITLGDMSVIVAVADTGLNFTHEDLASAVWANDDPIGGGDDDGNGFIDDWRGWDFINNDNDPVDGNSHGTHVAGTIAARTDNNKGVAGMAQVTIMPLQVFSSGGGGTWEAIAEAIVYATDNDADLLNYSGGGGGGAAVLADACTYAWDNGLTVCAAAGNWGIETDFFPAAYPETIAVGATDDNDNIASFSNQGNWMDVCAPGVDIISSDISGNSGYSYKSGTSMATPHVAGAVALMYTLNSSLSTQDVRDLLRDNAVDLGSNGFDKFYGYGRVDVLTTLQAIGGSGDCLDMTVDALVAGNNATWAVSSATPNATIAVVYGFAGGSTNVNSVAGYCATFDIAGVNTSRVICQKAADGSGNANCSKSIPDFAFGKRILSQAAERDTCPDECVSNLDDQIVQ